MGLYDKKLSDVTNQSAGTDTGAWMYIVEYTGDTGASLHIQMGQIVQLAVDRSAAADTGKIVADSGFSALTRSLIGENSDTGWRALLGLSSVITDTGIFISDTGQFLTTPGGFDTGVILRDTGVAFMKGTLAVGDTGNIIRNSGTRQVGIGHGATVEDYWLNVNALSYYGGDTGDAVVQGVAGKGVIIAVNNATPGSGKVWQFDTGGHLRPVTDSVYDIGSVALAPRVIYADTFKQTNKTVLDTGNEPVYAAVSDVLEVGFPELSVSAGPFDTGAGSGTYTPTVPTANLQKMTNRGPLTIAIPSDSGTMVVEMTNDTGAAAPTTSAWTLVDGDTFSTDTGVKNLMYMSRLGQTSHLTNVQVDF